MSITKSDFRRYLECKKNAWLYKHRPELFPKKEEDSFQDVLAKQGAEVELYARQLFPTGVLVDGIGKAAIAQTKKLIDDRETVIFQATFLAEDFLVMVDILEYEKVSDSWIIHEVKSTTEKEETSAQKRLALKDIGFQKFVLEKAGFSVSQTNLIELNKEFRKHGEIIARELLSTTDVTEEITELVSEITVEAEEAKRYLSRTEEPRGNCDCIYKGRSNHCETFAHSNPEVPKYSVHDIARIGNSKKKLRELVDSYIFDINGIPEDFELTDNQRNQVTCTQQKRTIICPEKVQQELGKLIFPLYFLDYETFPTAVPRYDGCFPYQQVPFQFSLHILDHPDGELIHKEFLAAEDANPIPKLAEALRECIGDVGSVVVWNQKFEKKCNQDMAEQYPKLSDFFININQRVFDLMEIFSKQLYIHPDFQGSASIKYVLPALVPELSYKNLSIQNGTMACQNWGEMVFGDIPAPKKEQIRQDLLKYCELDTLAMVRVWGKIRNISV